jgi:hypothetical protein
MHLTYDDGSHPGGVATSTSQDLLKNALPRGDVLVRRRPRLISVLTFIFCRVQRYPSIQSTYTGMLLRYLSHKVLYRQLQVLLSRRPDSEVNSTGHANVVNVFLQKCDKYLKRRTQDSVNAQLAVDLLYEILQVSLRTLRVQS